MGYSNTSDYRIKTAGTGGGQALGSKPASKFNPTAKGLPSFTPQQMTAIKNSPKGKLPNFLVRNYGNAKPIYKQDKVPVTLASNPSKFARFQGWSK